MLRAILGLTKLHTPGPTFRELANHWLDEAEGRLRSAWYRNAKRILHKEILPALGDLRADQITRRDVARMLEAVKGPGVANQALTLVRCVFREGIETGRLETANPAQGIRRRHLKIRDRVLTEPEIRAVWLACEGLADYGTIIRLLLLTGQRRAEIGSLAWTEVMMDAPGGPVIELPAFRSKNKKPHRVPLSPMAVALLPPRRPGHPHLFGRRVRGGFSGWSAGKAELDASLGGMPPWCVHDCRRTVATHMAERGIALPHIIEAVLNHQSGHKHGVAGVYNRALYAAEKRAALDAWATELARIVSAG